MNGTKIYYLDQSGECVLGEQEIPGGGRDPSPGRKQIEALLQKIWPERSKELDDQDVQAVDTRAADNSCREHSQRNSMHLQTNVRVAKSSSSCTNQRGQNSHPREGNSHILRQRIGKNPPLVYPATRNKGPSSFSRLPANCCNISHEARRDCTSKVGELELRGESVSSNGNKNQGSKILLRHQERSHSNRGVAQRVLGCRSKGVGYSISRLPWATRHAWLNWGPSEGSWQKTLGHQTIQHKDIQINSGEESHRIRWNIRRCCCYSWSQINRDNEEILSPDQDESQSEECT